MLCLRYWVWRSVNVRFMRAIFHNNAWGKMVAKIAL